MTPLRSKRTTLADAVGSKNNQEQRSRSLRPPEGAPSQRPNAPKRRSMTLKPRRSIKTEEKKEWDHDFVEGEPLGRSQQTSKIVVNEDDINQDWQGKLRDTPTRANASKKKVRAPRRTSSLSEMLKVTQIPHRRSTKPDALVAIRPTTGQILKKFSNDIIHKKRWSTTKPEYPVARSNAAHNSRENGDLSHRSASKLSVSKSGAESLIQKRIRRRNTTK